MLTVKLFLAVPPSLLFTVFDSYLDQAAFPKHQFPTDTAEHCFASVTTLVVHIKIICIRKYDIKTMTTSICIVSQTPFINHY